MFKMFILFEVKLRSHKITGVDRGLQKTDMFGAKGISERVVMKVTYVI